MVQLSSSSRFSSINSLVILTQTDTTVGFLSQNAQQLQKIKSRDNTKPFIKVFLDFQNFKEKHRVPNGQKKLVRRAKRTTFIIKNKALRIAKTPLYSAYLEHLKWSYSTSANESGKNFERTFCEAKADIIVEDKNSLFEGKASKLYKLNNKKIKRLR